MTGSSGFGVADLAEVLGRVPDPVPVGAVLSRLQVVAGGLDRFADACGDTALINDARLIAAAARRAGRDHTTALTRLRVDVGETSTHTTDSAPGSSAGGGMASGRP